MIYIIHNHINSKVQHKVAHLSLGTSDLSSDTLNRLQLKKL